jgi:uracil phosphoribosyltransferase
MTSVTVLDHPLLAHKLTRIRDRDTATPEFRTLLVEAAMMVAVEATRHLPIVEIEVATPLAKMKGIRLDGPSPVLISILRAGNGLLDGFLRIIPDADVGHIGLYRDETTLQAHEYLLRLPDLANRDVIIVDPMLATGHTSVAALDRVTESVPRSILFACLVAAPEGISELHSHHPQVPIVTAALDSHLNESGYIVPGLGDAGDRLYGTT